MIFKPLIYTIRKNRTQMISSFVLFVISFYLLWIVLNNISIYYKSSKNEVVNAISNPKEYYLTNGEVTVGSITEYFSDSDKLTGLKDFYIALSKNPKYQFLDKHFQGIYIKDFDNEIDTPIFYNGYEEGNTNSYNTGNYIVNMYKNVTIGYKTQQYYNFNVIDGRLFTENDFISYEVVPVLLGYEYKDYYEIGDEFEGEYLSVNFHYKVVGILQKDTVIRNKEEIVYLDRYIISPSLIVDRLPTNHAELFFQSASYMQKIHGSVVLSDEFGLFDFSNELEKLCNVYGMFDIIVLNESPVSISFYKVACYLGIKNLILFAVLFSFIIIVLNVCSLLCNMREFSRFYGILLLNGLPESSVQRIMVMSVMTPQVLAFFVSLLLVYSREKVNLGFICILLACFLFNLLLNINFGFRYAKKEIDYFIRGE